MRQKLSLIRLENKYSAIQALSKMKGYPVQTLCAILKLNRSSYYKWLRRDTSEQDAKDSALIEKLCELHNECNGIFGYRRMQLNLLRRFDLRVNKKRVYRVMRAIGLRSVIRKKRPKYLRSKPEITAENVLDRKFVAGKPGEKWLTDVTEFKYNGGKLYLSAILDLYDRSIVSYKIGHNNNNQLAFDTFEAAINEYPKAVPLFHSDRGYQYTSKLFRAKLDAQGLTQSMSRVGHCIDNGPMEAFWGTLKAEMYHLRRFNSFGTLSAAIDDYIDFYNNRRYQARLGGLTPLEFREMLATA